ncbi:hypothetical protein HYPGJ_20992 [Hyphomicrobium sp. GJ21]|nr:hypothetical protein HYPGJ_20992 [Hyphomicrobium sp. GJ21]
MPGWGLWGNWFLSESFQTPNT